MTHAKLLVAALAMIALNGCSGMGYHSTSSMNSSPNASQDGNYPNTGGSN